MLIRELSKIATTIKTKLGRGKHDHIGLIIKDAAYKIFSHNVTSFTIPEHP